MDRIFEKADFSAGSDHKERLRKQLFEEGGISMKITDELKGKLENAGSAEEVSKILEKTREAVEEAGVILDDAELDKAAGGSGNFEYKYIGEKVPFI